MTLVKKRVDDFRNLSTDPITKFTEKEKERREDKRLKNFGVTFILIMFILMMLFKDCN